MERRPVHLRTCGRLPTEEPAVLAVATRLGVIADIITDNLRENRGWLPSQTSAMSSSSRRRANCGR